MSTTNDRGGAIPGNVKTIIPGDVTTISRELKGGIRCKVENGKDVLHNDPCALGVALLKVLKLDNQQVKELRLIVPFDGVVRIEADMYLQADEDEPAARAVEEWVNK